MPMLMTYWRSVWTEHRTRFGGRSDLATLAEIRLFKLRLARFAGRTFIVYPAA